MNNVERTNLLDLQKEELTPQEKEEIYGKKIEKQNIGPDKADEVEEKFLAKNEAKDSKKSKEIEMTQKKNEERGIEFFKKKIARLKKEIEKINNKKEKDPGNKNFESRSTELEEILKKAEEELTLITIPDDKEGRGRLEIEEAERQKRLEEEKELAVAEEGEETPSVVDLENKEKEAKEAAHWRTIENYLKSDAESLKEYYDASQMKEEIASDIVRETIEDLINEENIKDLLQKSNIDVNDNNIKKASGMISEIYKNILDKSELEEVEETPVEGESESAEPIIPTEPVETEAGRSWEEIGKRARGAEEAIKGMEAKVFEEMEGVEENHDIPKHEKEETMFSLGIKEGKLDTVRITTEMAQLKAQEFKLKEGIKEVRLKLEEEGLDETKEGELQKELKGLEIERHKIIRETTRLAIEKRNGLESLKLSIEVAVADQNSKVSEWEKNAGENKKGFVSKLAGAIKNKTEEARATLAESYKRINKESESDMINDVERASSFNELKSVIDNLKTADTKEEAQNFLSELYNRLDSLEKSVDLDKELDEMRKDLNSRKGILKLKLKKLTISERKVFESLLDRVKVLADNKERLWILENGKFIKTTRKDLVRRGIKPNRLELTEAEEKVILEKLEREGGEIQGETPLPSSPVNEVQGEEGAGEREQLGNEKKEEIKRILNGLEPEKIEILKQAFSNAIDAGYANWKVAALFRDSSDINDIIIKDNSEVLEGVTVEQLMGVIQGHTEGEGSGDGEDLEEGENGKEITDEMRGKIKEGFEKLKEDKGDEFDKINFANFPEIKRLFGNAFTETEFSDGLGFLKRNLELSYEEIKDIKTNDLMKVLKEAYEEVKREDGGEKEAGSEREWRGNGKEITGKTNEGVEDEYSDFRNDVAKTLHLGVGRHAERVSKIQNKIKSDENKLPVFLEVMEGEIRKAKDGASLLEIFNDGFDICQDIYIESGEPVAYVAGNDPSCEGIRKAAGEKIEELIKNGLKGDEILNKAVIRIRSLFHCNDNSSIEEVINKLKNN